MDFTGYRLPAFIVAVGSLWGCAQHMPEADDLQLATEELARANFAGFQHAPQAERQRSLEDGPYLEVRPKPSEYPEDDDLCPFEVKAHNFPAISTDAGLVARAAKHVDGNADETAEYMEVSLIATAAGHEGRGFQIYSRSDHDTDRCGLVLARVRRAVRETNRVLTADSWRTLPPLDIDLEPNFYGQDPDDERVDATDERRVELVYRNTELVARVPGVEVLDRIEREDWRQFDDEFCDQHPHLSEVWADRTTGVALVSYNHSSGGCLCDDHEWSGTVRLAPAVFEEIDRRHRDGDA